MRPVGTVGRFLPQGQTAEATDSRYLGASCKGRVASQVRRVAASYLEFLTWRSLTSQTPRKYERCVEELIEPFGSCIQLGSEPDRAVELNHSPFFLLHPFLPFSFWLCALAASRPGWWLVPSGRYWKKIRVEQRWVKGSHFHSKLPLHFALWAEVVSLHHHCYGQLASLLGIQLFPLRSQSGPAVPGFPAPQQLLLVPLILPAHLQIVSLLVSNYLSWILFPATFWLVQLLPGCVTLIILSLSYLSSETEIKLVRIVWCLSLCPVSYRKSTLNLWGRIALSRMNFEHVTEAVSMIWPTRASNPPSSNDWIWDDHMTHSGPMRYCLRLGQRVSFPR